jgi:hypothetical protein
MSGSQSSPRLTHSAPAGGFALGFYRSFAYAWRFS